MIDMSKQKLKLSELAESIKNFEDVHCGKGYFNEDGSLTDDGWNLLHSAEVEWGNDPKWHDYEKFHLRSRLENYWYGEGEEADNEYWEAWCELHPKETMKP
jgi:hypothetical protein